MRVQEQSMSGALPAWPTLVGLQLVLAALLAGASWRLSGPLEVAHTPLETRALTVDLEPAARAIAEARASSRREGRALLATEQNRATTFLALTAAAADLEDRGIQWSAPVPATPGAEAVGVRVAMAGDVFDLPVFLDGLHRQSATVRVRALAVSVAPGGACEAWIELLYHRATEPDAGEIEALVARALPASDAALRALLVQAGGLAGDRAFAQDVQARATAAAEVRARLQRELPAALVAAREHGGRVSWSPQSGVTLRVRP